jgi:hypothetical protein
MIMRRVSMKAVLTKPTCRESLMITTVAYLKLVIMKKERLSIPTYFKFLGRVEL